MPKLRRLNLDNLNFSVLQVPFGCTVTVLEIQNAEIYLPYTLRYIHHFSKVTTLRLIKVQDRGPEADFDDDAFLDEDLPLTIQSATLHHCDWETTRSFFQAVPSGTNLKELRLTFLQFESNPIFSQQFAGTPLSLIPFETLPSSGVCCMSVIDSVRAIHLIPLCTSHADVITSKKQFEYLKRLTTLYLTGPDTLLIRIIQAMVPSESGGTGAPDPLPYATHTELCLPALKHLEVKVSNGMVCGTPLKGYQHHCNCSVAESGFALDLVKLFQHRIKESAPLEVVKLSNCLVDDKALVNQLVPKVGYFKCRCADDEASADVASPPHAGSVGAAPDSDGSGGSRPLIPTPLDMLFGGLLLAGEMAYGAH